jgi:hypothetical protein
VTSKPADSTPAATARADTAREARFGKLPERICPEEMVAEQAATMPDPTKDTYNSDEWLVRYSL